MEKEYFGVNAKWYFLILEASTLLVFLAFYGIASSLVVVERITTDSFNGMIDYILYMILMIPAIIAFMSMPFFGGIFANEWYTERKRSANNPDNNS